MTQCFFSAAMSCLILVPCLLGEQVPQRVYSVACVTELPVIDGILDDTCWQALPETSEFTSIMTRSGSAEAQTYVKIGRSATGLVMSFRCIEPDMDGVIEGLKTQDNYRESVEIFIDAGLTRTTYRHFRVSAGGMREVSTGYDNTYEGDITDWQVVVNFEEDSWTIEMEIPFLLISDTPDLGDRWGFNVNRGRSVCEPAEYSCWSNTQQHFHMPDKFGQVIFGSLDNWMATCIKNFQSYDEELRSMIKSYPQSLISGEELVKRLPPTEGRIPMAAVTEVDKLKAMEQIFAIEQEYQNVLKDARLMVIEGEFK